MGYDEYFDGVVFLTWSDWKTEPRSNRYHYATRFARRLPVFFVQADGVHGEVTAEDAEPVTIVHVSRAYDYTQAELLRKFLADRGIHRALAWIYNVNFTAVVDVLRPKMTIFHATEDYAAPEERLKATSMDVRPQLQAMLQRCDMVVAVSAGVASSYMTYMRLDSPPVVLPNGCDFDFWHATGAFEAAGHPNKHIALYQGSINDRLDFELLRGLADALPDWRFSFCGRVAADAAGWDALKALPNVDYHGVLSPEQIAELAGRATVGLIPFIDDGLMRRSLPLKAYEYLACGLPVVTVPIDSLAEHSDVFTEARTSAEFARAMRELAPSRHDPQAVAHRLSQARSRSYDNNFSVLSRLIAQHCERLQGLNILVLYDDGSIHVGTIVEHLRAFKSYSDFNVHYMSATGNMAGAELDKFNLDFTIYDAVLIHYSIRVSVRNHLSPIVSSALQRYDGPKLLFIQDEYDTTDTSLDAIELLGISTVFTNVPEPFWGAVYPRSRFPYLMCVPTLTGYVPEDPELENFVTPLNERTIRIGYRGRKLPHHYGELGYDKYRIGVDIKRRLEGRDIPIDVEVDDSKRIYGLDWYRFVGSVRATLGTESGSNVFDFDGGLAKLAAEHAQLEFPEFARRYLAEHDGKIRMNQISPRVFEAVRLRTALILFEGEYSNVLEPWRHFMPLKKDYSNLDEILKKLEDLEFLSEMTERAYREIVLSGRYSYASFIRQVDAVIRRRVHTKARCEIHSGPLVAVSALQTLSTIQGNVADVLISQNIVSRSLRTRLIQARRVGPSAAAVSKATLWARLRQPSNDAEPARRTLQATAISALYGLARKTWRMVPTPVRQRVPSTAARRIWRVLPAGVRHRIARAVFERRP